MIKCRDGKCWETIPNVFEKISQQYDENNIIDQIELEQLQHWS